tara:strand:+ start:629 stop:2833 length:2205 start_codon:yes stop_codon:yes gene_type:complete
MVKKLLFFTIFLIFIIFFLIIYLSKYGLETNKFNSLIGEQLKKYDKNLELNIKKVKLYLIVEDLLKPKIKIKTDNSILKSGDNEIKIAQITTSINPLSYFKDKFTLNHIIIETLDNKIHDLISIIAKHGNAQLIILNSFIKKGNFQAVLKVNFDENGNVKKNFTFHGKIKDAKVKLINQNVFENINLKFEKKQNYNLENLNFNYKKMKFFSDLIIINHSNNKFIFQGDLRNEKTSIDTKIITSLIQNELNFIKNKKIEIKTKNNFYFKLDKNKIKDLKILSKIDIENLTLNFKSNLIKKYVKNYNNFIKLKNNSLEIDYHKKKFNIKGKSKYSLKDKNDEIAYEINKKNDFYKFETLASLNNNNLAIKYFSYIKKNNIPAEIKLNGVFEENKKIIFEEIFYKEDQNYFRIKDLNLNKDYKFKYVNKVDINIKNQNDKYNELFIERNENKYKIFGETFDINKIIDDLLNNKNKNSIFDNFSNFNSVIFLDVKKAYIDNFSYFKNLKGKINFLNNKISSLDISALVNNKSFSYKIKTLSENKIITNMYLDYPEPLVKKYNFVKGFKDGSLDFNSVKNKNTSESNLKIYNFKLTEMPALTKILTLASLQGIADILTGEGIRFDEFDMKFLNEKDTMVIDEIYAIGPAISIMMSGYIKNKKLVSLRGTLVPATTINKTIAAIPILGDILIGKKTGEGVFGVSFKIKGHPKDLKTTVNPIKTLTPRFITRTLEKIKKNN